MRHFKPWFAFIFLGAIAWGTSFLWIKVALNEIGPFTLVTLRLALAAAGAWVYVRASGIPLPKERSALGAMAFLGLVNTAIPFTLISWGETRIDSGLAGILNGTVPLFTIVIAHLFLVDDRLSPAKIAGLLLGFGGLILLLSPDAGSEGPSRDLLGQGAVLLAALLYAASSVFIRRTLRNQHSMVIAAVSLSSALVMIGVALPFAEPDFALPATARTWLSLVWLGWIGTTGAYLAYFYLINSWGPTRSTMVTYIFPLVAVALGVLFLDEPLGWKIVLGGLAIVGGIVTVNWRTLLPSARTGLGGRARQPASGGQLGPLE